MSKCCVNVAPEASFLSILYSVLAWRVASHSNSISMKLTVHLKTFSTPFIHIFVGKVRSLFLLKKWSADWTVALEMFQALNVVFEAFSSSNSHSIMYDDLSVFRNRIWWNDQSHLNSVSTPFSDQYCWPNPFVVQVEKCYVNWTSIWGSTTLWNFVFETVFLHIFFSALQLVLLTQSVRCSFDNIKYLLDNDTGMSHDSDVVTEAFFSSISFSVMYDDLSIIRTWFRQNNQSYFENNYISFYNQYIDTVQSVRSSCCNTQRWLDIETGDISCVGCCLRKTVSIKYTIIYMYEDFFSYFKLFLMKWPISFEHLLICVLKSIVLAQSAGSSIYKNAALAGPWHRDI